MKKSKQNFLEWNNQILISSFKKLDLNIILIIILDIFFYFLSGYLFIFWLQKIQARMASVYLPSDLLSLGPEKAQQVVSEVRTFYYLIVFSFILLIIAIIFLASIFKCIIWAKTTKTKFSFSLTSKFLALNLIWMGFWFIVIFLISLLIEPSFVARFAIGAVILSLYLTNTLYTLFMKSPKIKTIFHSITLSVTKIHMFLLPYAIISLLLFAIVRLINFMNFKYSQILLGLIIVIYAAFVRYYVSTLVMEAEAL